MSDIDDTSEDQPDETPGFDDAAASNDDGMTAFADSVDDEAIDQSEIDDLFGMSMDEEEEATGIEAIVNNAAVRHQRLPLLEACIERLVRSLTNTMRKFTLGNVELSLADSTSIRFGNYIESVPLPTLISIFEIPEWNGYGLITIDSPLIYSIIDVLLGGGNSTKSLAIEGRSFTKIEAMLIERLIRLILDEMTTAFEPLSKVTFEHERLESTPSRAMIVHPTDKAVLFKIDVDMDNRGGSAEILLPYATLEPVASLLKQMFMGEKFAKDGIWETHLSNETLMSNTELDVVLGQQTIPLKTMMTLEVGTTLPLSVKPDDFMIVRCGDTPLMRGKVGRVGDNMAVQVDGWYSQADRRVVKNKSAGANCG